MLSRGITPEKENAMPKTAELRQTTVRARPELLREAKFFLDEDGSSITEFCVKQLEQYVQKRKRLSSIPHAETQREPQAS
jgi:hypothetical protein